MSSAAMLHLCFERDARGLTILRVRQQQPPWRVVRGFSTPSGETLAHIHNLSGGVLDSDSLFWRMDVGAHAQAQVTTTGATRIYRSRSATQTAAQHTEVHVGEGAYLEYLPDQLIPFAGSRYRQTTRVNLEAAASLIWWEHVSPGREASGEIFRFASLSSELHVVAAGEPVAIEQWTLEPISRRADSAARLGPFRHFGSAYVCRAGESADFWKNFESELQEVSDRQSNAEILWGVSRLKAHGLSIRVVSTSGRLLRESWVKVWEAAKWRLCGRAADLPRKVY